MSATVTNTLAVISSVQDLSIRLISVAKSDSVLSFFMAAPALFTDVRTLASDATLAVPELESLDANATAQLGAAAYSLVSAVIAALKA